MEDAVAAWWHVVQNAVAAERPDVDSTTLTREDFFLFWRVRSRPLSKGPLVMQILRVRRKMYASIKVLRIYSCGLGYHTLSRYELANVLGRHRPTLNDTHSHDTRSHFT